MKLVVPAVEWDTWSIGGSPDVKAPLPASPVAARLQAYAALNNFSLSPAMYGARFPTDSMAATASVTPSTLEGAFIVVALAAPLELSGETYDVTVRSGSRTLTEGRVRADLAFGTSRMQTLAWLPAPIVVYKGDTLYWDVVNTANLSVDDGVVWFGFHVHDSRGGRLPAEVSNAFAELVRNEGEFYACGIINDESASENISYDTIITTLVMESEIGGPDTGDVDTVNLWIADLQVTPLDFKWSLVAPLTELQRPLVFDDIRWPIAAGDRVQMNLRHLAGTPKDFALVIIGRRGPA